MKLQERDPNAYKIIGAAMRVHQILGCGFLEAVYADALEIEFQKQNIPYVREKLINVFYEGIKLNAFYKSDFFCYNGIIVELKAISQLGPSASAQTMNAIKATRSERGLLFNFGEPSLKYKHLTRQEKWGYMPNTIKDSEEGYPINSDE